MTMRDTLRLDLVPVKIKNSTNSIGLPMDSDQALVERARGGDFSAFETLFERHRELVYRFAYQMAPRRDDAEDIVQEVFLRAFKNLHRYRDEAKFTTWLLRIATNYGTDRARMHTRRNTLEQQEADGALRWMTEGSQMDDPLTNLEQERRKQIVRNAINALPDQHKNAIVMRDLEEMDYEDIAEFFECTVGAAKLRVLRARRALRDEIVRTHGVDGGF